MTLDLGGAPYIGTHESSSGSVHGGGAPVPVVDLDANFGDIEFHGESVPHARTRYYGNVFDPSYSAVEAADATVRFYTPGRRIAFGVGYGLLLSTTYRTFPSGAITNEATGPRLELHGRFPTSSHGHLELTFGGQPIMSGTVLNAIGVPGAKAPVDSESGAQIDATAEEIVTTHKTLSVVYGVRYVNQTLGFSTSNALLERNAAILPFAALRFQL